MFDQLFTRTCTIARHQAGPYVALRVSYLEHLFKHGMCRQWIPEVATRIHRLSAAIDLDKVRSVSVRDLEIFAKQMGAQRKSPRHVSEPAWSAKGNALRNEIVDAFSWPTR